MKTSITRRDFLNRTSATGIGLVTLGTAGAFRATASPNDKIVIGIMGCNGRGMAHIAEHLSVPNVEIAYVCDVDKRKQFQRSARKDVQRCAPCRGHCNP